jgi:hypothetical protein
MGGIPQGTIGAGMAGGSASESDATTARKSLGATSPGSPDPFLLGSSECVSPSINWRWVEGEAQLVCLQAATVERLLHDTLASIYRNILHPVQVSLRWELCFCDNGIFSVYLFFSRLAPTAPIPAQHGCCSPTGGGYLDT